MSANHQGENQERLCAHGARCPHRGAGRAAEPGASLSRDHWGALVAAAKRLRSDGRRVLPLSGKRPCMGGAPIADWPNLDLADGELAQAFHGATGVGLVLGPASGGIADVDLDSPEAVRLAPFLPATTWIHGRASKPASHHFYATDENARTTRFRDADGAMILEFRAGGQQTMIPPSVHPDAGEALEWVRFDGEPAEVPSADLTAICGRLAAAALLARHWERGSRQDSALAFSGWARRGGWSKDKIAAFLTMVGVASQDEELESRVQAGQYTVRNQEEGRPTTGRPTLEGLVGGAAVVRLAQWLGLSAKVADGGEPSPCTDVANAERFIRDHGNDVRYDYTSGKWLHFAGTRWVQNSTATVREMAKQTARSIYSEAVTESNPKLRKELLSWAKKTESNRGLSDMLAVAASSVAVEAGDLDRDVWLLNVLNGTMDLRTGQLRAHRREDMITKLAPVAYDLAAARSEWEAFMSAIMKGRTGLISYLQELAGMCLTGDVREQALDIFFGNGANGKTTFIRGILGVLGDYGRMAAPDLLARRKGERHPTELADLRGARLVVDREAEEGQRLAESLVKALTGGDRIKARFMRQDFFEFDPTHKLIVVTNHKPVVRGLDKGIWRRIRLVPFEADFEGREDRDLEAKLARERSGILNWALEGLERWRTHGSLEIPKEIKDATSAFRAESDLVERFLTAHCARDPTAKTVAKDLKTKWEAWTHDLGEEMKWASATRRLREKGLKAVRGTGGERMWAGIRLRRTDEEREGTDWFGGAEVAA